MRITVHHQMRVDLGVRHPHSVQHILLTPRSGAGQTVTSWTLSLPGMDKAARFEDGFGNIAHVVSQTKAEGELTITIEGAVETMDRHGVLGRVRGEPVHGLYKRVTALTTVDPELVDPFRGAQTGRIAVLHGLMERLNGEPAPSTGAGQMQANGQAQSQSQSQSHQLRSQSQAQSADPDSEAAPDAVTLAHSFIGVARALDIPARYVSGYLYTGGENTSFHAWAEAYDEALGWIGFDPWLNLCPTEHHVRVAAGLDAGDTVPVKSFPEGGPLTVLGMKLTALST